MTSQEPYSHASRARRSNETRTGAHDGHAARPLWVERVDRGLESERNKRVVRALVEAINAQNWDRLDKFVAPGFVRHSYAAGRPGVRSLDDFKRFLQGEFETFPDAHESIEDAIAEGDKVAARHRFHGTQSGPMGPYAPSGRTMTAEYIAIYRLVNGLIVEAWAEWDNLAGLAQLGHYQSPA